MTRVTASIPRFPGHTILSSLRTREPKTRICPNFTSLLLFTHIRISLNKTAVLFGGAYHAISTVPHPLQGSQVIITPDKLYKGLVRAHSSIHNSLSLSLSPVKVFEVKHKQCCSSRRAISLSTAAVLSLPALLVQKCKY
jgi:hypothetical protein